MAAPSEERKRHRRFAHDLVRELKSAAIGPDTMLWHYTNGSALIGILETMSLYSTHISCLNDATELRYGSKLFSKALATLKANATLEGHAAALLGRALEYFKEDPDLPAQVSVPFFVACFSEERNDLSQWRAYGNGENGYAIGFKAQDLGVDGNSGLMRINYDAALHSRLAQRAASSMLEFYVAAVEKYAPSDLVRFEAEFLESWDQEITFVAPLIKDPGFSKELECRIVRCVYTNEFENLKFFQKKMMMSRHFPLRPSRQLAQEPGPNPGADTPYRLPITEVIVGPCRHPQVSRASLETLLLQKGYPKDMVSISKIPFQNT